MKNLFVLGGVLVAFFLTPISANAQNWSDDQKEVWSVIELWWSTSQKKDSAGVNNLLADDFAGWDNEMPMPQNSSSFSSWYRFNSENSTQLKYEVYPLKVIVHGDMAVVHYYFQSVVEDKEGKIKDVQGRWSDTLVRDNNGWKFIAWQGGADSE